MDMEPLGNLWVCVCCMLIHANGECGDETHADEPWNKLGEREVATMGLVYEEHTIYCLLYQTGERPDDYECDCERIEFSSSPCDGCGSRDAGTRYAFTLWKENH